MHNATIYCHSLHDSMLSKIKKVGYVPVGLGSGKFSAEWLRDDTLINISHKNKYYAEIQSKRLLTSQRMQKMIKEEVQSALDEVGVSPEYLIERFKDIADISERDSDKLRSLEMLAKISGLFDTNNSKEQLTVWTGFTPEQLESIKGGNNARVEAHIERTSSQVESKSS